MFYWILDQISLYYVRGDNSGRTKRFTQQSKLPQDPDDPNHDIWELLIAVRSLREQLKEFETGFQRKINEQLCTLEGLLYWCDHLLYQSCKLYSTHAREKEVCPEEQ